MSRLCVTLGWVARQLSSVFQITFSEMVQVRFRVTPVICVDVNQYPKFRPMIMLLEMCEFMNENVVDTLSRRFDEVRVDDDLSRRGTASPLT